MVSVGTGLSGYDPRGLGRLVGLNWVVSVGQLKWCSLSQNRHYLDVVGVVLLSWSVGRSVETVWSQSERRGLDMVLVVLITRSVGTG